MALTASPAAAALPQTRFFDGGSALSNDRAPDDIPKDIVGGKPGSRIAYALPAVPLATLTIACAGVLTLAYAKWQVDQNPEVIAQAAADITQKVSDTARAMRQMGMNLPQPGKARVESLVGDMFAAAKSGQIAVSDFGHQLVDAIRQREPSATARPLGWINPATGVFSECNATGIAVVLDGSGAIRAGQPVARMEGDDGREIEIHAERRKTADGKDVLALGVVIGGSGGVAPARRRKTWRRRLSRCSARRGRARSWRAPLRAPTCTASINRPRVLVFRPVRSRPTSTLAARTNRP